MSDLLCMAYKFSENFCELHFRAGFRVSGVLQRCYSMGLDCCKFYFLAALGPDTGEFCRKIHTLLRVLSLCRV